MIFGIGPFELIVILVVALLVFGPDRLPQVAGQVGRMIRDFRRWSADLMAEFQEVSKEFSTEFAELKAATDEISQELRGVQADLAGVHRELVGELQGMGTAPALAAGGTEALVSNGATTSAWAAPTMTTVMSTEPAMSVPAPPPVATKENPRVDVSVFDLDDLVVMPRTSRPPTNGHLNGHHAPAAPAPPTPSATTRQPRPARRAVVTYQRPKK
jgi:Tat protein translocase TatB subunit